ncbi:MAG TPA: response regulator transcription factor, partial [Flavobacterium sp.]
MLAEDHVILRHGIISLLQKDPDLNVVGEAGNGLEVIEIMKAKSVDLLIADITMPFIDGIEATKFVTDNYETKVMILSMQQELRYVYNSFEAGAIGYMLKTSGSEELVFAIKKVASGHPYIS